MHDYSVVFSPYGVPGGITGAMAVVGPTRMHYSETISTVRFMAGLMSEMLATFYDESDRPRELIRDASAAHRTRRNHIDRGGQ